MKKSDKTLSISNNEFNNGYFVKAIKILEEYLKSINLDLCDKKVLKELGYLHYLMGNAVKAEKYLKLALKKYKQKNIILDILSQLYQKELNHSKLKKLNIEHFDPFSEYLSKSEVYKVSQANETQFKFRTVQNWHLIKPKFGGKEINCMFDTGSTNLTCISSDLFNELLTRKCAKKFEFGSINIDAPLANFEAEFAIIDNIEIGGIKVSNIPWNIPDFL